MKNYTYQKDLHRKILKKDEISQLVLNYDFDILSFNYWQERQYRAIHNNLLDYYRLILIEKGKFVFHIHQKTITLDAYDCLLLPPYLLYSAECIEEDTGSFFFYDFLLTTKKSQTSLNFLNLTQPLFVQDIISETTMNLVRRAFDEVNKQCIGSYLSVKLSLERFFIEIYKHALATQEMNLTTLTTQEEKIIASCLQYFATHLSSPIKVKELCDALHISQSALYQCFHKTFHQSIQQTILDYKLKQSLAFMLQPYSIQEISSQCGFVSSYHFSKAFKQKFGLSPLNFKKSYLQNNQDSTTKKKRHF